MRRVLLLLFALSCPGFSHAGEQASRDETLDQGAPPRGRLEPETKPESKRSPPSIVLTANNAFVSAGGPPKDDAAGAMKSGEALVKMDGIKAVFENITQGTVTTVRHRSSGLICIRPWILETPKTQTREFDPEKQTGCISVESGVQNNLVVIPNSDSVSAAKALAALMARERKLHPALTIKKIWDPQSQSQHASGSLVSASQYIHLAVAAVNGWIVLDETSGSQDQDADCDRLAEGYLNYAIATIRKS